VEITCTVLQAERCTVWLYDEEAAEYFTEVATGEESIRIPADRGLVGSCGGTREIINVPDCYADERFDQSVDRDTGYRTCNMLSVPLIGYDDSLIGVLQVLNRIDGPFEGEHVETAEALSAQCAVALHRARMIEGLLEKERLERDMDVAKQIQSGTLPQVMPELEGYDIHGWSRPADKAGGDAFDIIPVNGTVLGLLLADATGHGVGPALSVTQVRSMLRMCAHLGQCDLQVAMEGINRQLCEDLPPERFVTAFLGLLDAEAHALDYLSGGQGPLIHLHADSGEAELFNPTSAPLGLFAELPPSEPARMDLAPGDLVTLISDGILEAENPATEQFGEERAVDILRRHREGSCAEMVRILQEETEKFSGTAQQADDMTILLIKRLP